MLNAKITAIMRTMEHNINTLNTITEQLTLYKRQEVTTEDFTEKEKETIKARDTLELTLGVELNNFIHAVTSNITALEKEIFFVHKNRSFSTSDLEQLASNLKLLNSKYCDILRILIPLLKKDGNRYIAQKITVSLCSDDTITNNIQYFEETYFPYIDNKYTTVINLVNATPEQLSALILIEQKKQDAETAAAIAKMEDLFKDELTAGSSAAAGAATVRSKKPQPTKPPKQLKLSVDAPAFTPAYTGAADDSGEAATGKTLITAAELAEKTATQLLQQDLNNNTYFSLPFINEALKLSCEERNEILIAKCQIHYADYYAFLGKNTLKLNYFSAMSSYNSAAIALINASTIVHNLYMHAKDETLELDPKLTDLDKNISIFFDKIHTKINHEKEILTRKTAEHASIKAKMQTAGTWRAHRRDEASSEVILSKKSLAAKNAAHALSALIPPIELLLSQVQKLQGSIHSIIAERITVK